MPLSEFGVVRVPFDTYIYRRRGRDRAQFPTLAEPVMQTYVIPATAFTRANSNFDPTSLRAVRLVFDRARVGQVLVDDVGLTRMSTP